MIQQSHIIFDYIGTISVWAEESILLISRRIIRGDFASHLSETPFHDERDVILFYINKDNKIC